MSTEPAVVSRLPAPPVSQADSILHMIERAARDPSIDVDKMLKLLDRRDQIVREEADRAWAVAMAQCQAAMRPVIADANNPSTRSKYATYAALDEAARPIYTVHGFAPSFDTDPASPPDWLHAFCDLSHIGGRTYRYHINMPADGKGARGNDVMTRTHAMGSAYTYARRYMLIGMFNLAVDKDDDGNAASKRNGGAEKISEDQLEELKTLLADAGADSEAIARLCQAVGIAGLEDLPLHKLSEARRHITEFKKWMQAKP